MTTMRIATGLVGLLLSALGAACQLSAEEQPCLDIPDGGCPGVDQTNCLDVTCAAIYTCQPNGSWILALPCPVREAGVDSSVDAPAPKEASAVRDAAIDVQGAFGGPGCVDLEQPDCPLGEALACGPDCCGCGDLFVCQDGVWNLWGECVDGGVQPQDGG
jgi:hypothetical protein